MGKIRRLLLGNGHSPGLLKRLLREVRWSRKNKSRKSHKLGEDGYLTLPYIDEKLLHKVKRIVKRSGLNVKVAWRNEHKLKRRLVHSAFTQAACPGGSRCNLCRSDFVGQCTQKNVVYLLVALQTMWYRRCNIDLCRRDKVPIALKVQ